MKLRLFNFMIVLLMTFSCKESLNNKTTESKAALTPSTESYGGNSLQVYTTAKDTDLRLNKTAKYTFTEKVQPLENEIAIFVNVNKKFQTYLGIGGAITDASSEVFSTLDEDKQSKLLQSLYGKDGIGYNIIRTSIHSSDFGLGSHTYIEDGDADLKTFSIEKDKEKRLPFIKRAIDLIGDDLVFYASP